MIFFGCFSSEEKKMASSIFLKDLQFVPPKLVHNALGWNVEYYIYDPVLSRMIRKRFRLNDLYRKCSSQKEFREKANRVLQDITEKLIHGWSPIGETQSNRYYVPIFDCLERFMSEKQKELRPASLRTYAGIINILRSWLYEDCNCIDFGREKAILFMDYCYNERSVSARTYNSYLKQMRVIFSWMQQNMYIKENPFVNIKKKREEPKKRDIISDIDKAKIKEWCMSNCPEYLIVIELIYYSLIRPTECSRLQVKHLRLKDHCICLPPSITKNHKERIAVLTTDMCVSIAKLIDGCKSDDYLFGVGFRPAKQPIRTKQYILKWERLRDELNLPKEYQLYSLRDTGITNKLESGLDPVSTMKASGHHDLGITTRYIDRIDTRFISEVLDKSPSF